MTEANQNFSKVAKMVDENGIAVILKNNSPCYVVLDFNKVEEENAADNQTSEEVSAQILKKHLKVFKELAK